MDVLSEEFKGKILNDIKRIELQLNSGTSDSQWALFLDLNGTYQSCISGFYMGLWGVSSDGTKISLIHIKERPDWLKDNLSILKAKLSALLYGVNILHSDSVSQTQVNVSNYVSVNVSFDQVRKDISNMSFLSEDETNDILKRILVIENIINSNETKKKKWEKVGPILKWIADKGFDVGIALLPLILKITEMN